MSDSEVMEKKGLFRRLRDGMSRSSEKLGENVGGVFASRVLDDDTLDQLEDILVASDLGAETAMEVTDDLREREFRKNVSADQVRDALSKAILPHLEAVEAPLEITSAKPHVMVFVGVNGTGKTTTIGKLASRFKAKGKSVMVAAGDTFRAAAIEQLSVWAERAGVPVIKGEQGADAAGLAFDAFEKARAEGIDILMIDTAGRLQNKQGLMAELEKIIRVLKKIDPAAPHHVIQVLDATTGQNAVGQVEAFRDTAGVTGLIMTKLDGTAKGGIMVSIARKFGLPVHYIGVGESAEDLQPFDARDFAKALAGMDR